MSGKKIKETFDKLSTLGKFCWGGIIFSLLYILLYLFCGKIPLFFPYLLILFIVGYLIIALGWATELSNKKAKSELKYDESNMPPRLDALIMLVAYVAALILCFATMQG